MRNRIFGTILFVFSFALTLSMYADARGSRAGVHRSTAVRSYSKRSIANWSTKGNLNPHTGKKGSKNP